MRNVTYVWDFGDGIELSAEPAITHKFNHAGNYSITCTVNNEFGSVTDSLLVNVYEGKCVHT